MGRKGPCKSIVPRPFIRKTFGVAASMSDCGENWASLTNAVVGIISLPTDNSSRAGGRVP